MDLDMNFKANIQEAFLSSTDLPAGISYCFRRAGRLSVYENSDPGKAQILLRLTSTRKFSTILVNNFFPVQIKGATP